MKVRLLSAGADFDFGREPSPQASALVRDLGLDTLFAAMAGGDAYFDGVARKVLLAVEPDVGTIVYRQHVLEDCLRNESAVRDIYDLAVEAIVAERHDFLGSLARSPSSVLYRSVSLLQMLAGILERLRAIAEEHGGGFASEGWQTLLAALRAELTDEYLATIREHLMLLRFDDGVLMSARLGAGNKGTDYVLRRQPAVERGWAKRLFGSGRKAPSHTYAIPDRDEIGARALEELRAQGLAPVAGAVAQSAEHVLNFLRVLRAELALYLGLANLRGRLVALGQPVCYPEVFPAGSGRRSAADIYDASLALERGAPVVGSDLNADGKNPAIVTGANQGGKSTFLRSIGIAQLLMQCGAFVPARAFAASACECLFTHFKREEDVEMVSGKFDEELRRMSGIVDRLVPNALVLFNESFASTNEREGSEIAGQVVNALTDRGVSVVFVTHQYEFASAIERGRGKDALFLRAERLADGTRTFNIVPGAPQQTSHGEDVYRQVFDRPAAH